MAKTFSSSIRVLRHGTGGAPARRHVSTNLPKKQIIRAELQDPIHHHEPSINMRTAIPGVQWQCAWLIVL